MSEFDKEQLEGPVAVLFGGISAEREISLQSGEAVLNALKTSGVEAEGFDTADEGWLDKVKGRFPHAFIALHGLQGEDGTIQAALSMHNITFTGSGVAASALALDKLRTKQLWCGVGLPTPDFELVDERTDWAELLEKWQTVIIKPVSEGSSIGMSMASDVDALKSAYELATQHGDYIIAEKWIDGAEFTISILGNKVLPAIRLETTHEFYDYDAKYLADDTKYIFPCGLSPEKLMELNQISLKAFNSLGCEGWGRVDAMQDEKGNFHLLEVNTVPGMTSHSLVPMSAKAMGFEFNELVLEILRLSVER